MVVSEYDPGLSDSKQLFSCIPMRLLFLYLMASASLTCPTSCPRPSDFSFSKSLFHSFHKYLLSTCCMSHLF